MAFLFLFLSAILPVTAIPLLEGRGDYATDGTPPPGFANTLFFDNFADLPAGSLPSADRWIIDSGTSYPGGPANWGTGEIQLYTTTPNNLKISSGRTLLLIPQKQGDGSWTSSRIESTPAHNFACGPGQKLRMEANLRLGNADPSVSLGIWPAFWVLGADIREVGSYHDWPAAGEIDILECLNGEPTVYQTVHCGTAEGGPCHEPMGIRATSPFSRGHWHTVAVEIDRTPTDASAESIAWIVDGTRTAAVYASTVGDDAAWAALAHSPKFLLLNVAVGGSFPNAVAQEDTPTAATLGGAGAALEVQHVGVYTT